jgi:competence protein ComFC
MTQSKKGFSTRHGFTVFHHFWKMVDWFYPPSCAGCGIFGERWCSACQDSVTQMKGNLCPHCGRVLEDNKVCTICTNEAHFCESLHSWGAFQGPLREAIHKLKYESDLGLGEIFSQVLTRELLDLGWSVDLVSPVPLSPGRMKERGYNQSGLLAQPLAMSLGICYDRRALKRVRETQSQVGLTAAERQINVNSAFWADAGKVQGKRVLVIDDVMTTGATLNACAQALKSAGAEKVYGLTLARAIQQ